MKIFFFLLPSFFIFLSSFLILPVGGQKMAEAVYGVGEGVLVGEKDDAEMVGLFPVKAGAVNQKQMLIA
jgi:hypothetical protein